MENVSPTIIVGHYGSGKTEFTANYAVYLQKQGLEPLVADLDIVNPYFRIREQKNRLGSEGVRVVSSNYEEDYYLDTPALAASLRACFEPWEKAGLVDVGGDPAGAVVLAQYAGLLRNRPYNMWMVVNANRPQTARAENVLGYMDAIERAGRLKVTGLINNTHLLRDTAPEDILREFRRRYPEAVVVLTLGKSGAVYDDGHTRCRHGIYKVPVVDTTAAGDTFTGFFLTAATAGMEPEEALRIASVASSLAVSRQGAAPSIPTMAEVLEADLAPC